MVYFPKLKKQVKSAIRPENVDSSDERKDKVPHLPKVLSHTFFTYNEVKQLPEKNPY